MAHSAVKQKSPLRANAEGKNCTLRLMGCCNHNPETVVLAHLRKFGWAGMGSKPSDLLAVFACSGCHDALDRRRNDVEVLDTDILRALGETLQIQAADGLITF